MAPRADLIDTAATAIPLGRALGRKGGEGCVHEIVGRTDEVAKIYNEPPSRDKVEKLREMVRMSSTGLRVACAWPTNLIYSQRDRQLVGVVMPRVLGTEIHNLYNPRARYVQFPKVKWDHLVWTARNVAAAFDVLHGHGVVMGDVNEGNILVQENGIVRLIDCDSYQISANGKHYVCGVGVGLWTPPELQGVNLQHTFRTVNHDRFGLAQIIFLLLFMGRHPFAGIPSTAENYDLEEAIQRYLFAYNPSDRRIRPPQVSLRIESLPVDLGVLFQKAFLKGSESANARPTADQWCQALDRLGRNLRTCSNPAKAHTYAVHLHTCPWCEIEKQHGTDFFWTAGTILTSVTDTQDLRSLLSAIQQIQPVPHVYKKPSDIQHAKVTPAPAAVPRISRSFIWGWFILAACIGVMLLGQPIAFLGILIAIGMIFSGTEHRAFAKERTSRRAILDRATKQIGELERMLSTELDRYDRDFHKKQGELLSAVDKLQNWPKEEGRIRAETEARKRELQLRAFLDCHLISEATIPNIGDKRKAKLAAYGVETALDVDKSIIGMPGFGEGLYETLRKWRASCEHRFRFNPNQSLPPGVIRDMENRIIQAKRSLESEVRSGPEQLNRFNMAMQMKINQYHAQLPTLAQNKIQADADLLAMG